MSIGSEEETGERKEGSDENYVSLKHKNAVASGKVLSTQKIQKYYVFHFSKKRSCFMKRPFLLLVGFFQKKKKTRPFQV